MISLEEGQCQPDETASQRIDRILQLPTSLKRLEDRNPLFIAFMLAWLLWYSVTISNAKHVNPAMSAKYGEVQQLACTSVHWTNANQCGLDGHNCRPFSGDPLAFRCPGGCGSAIITTPVTVGGYQYNNRPLVIGSRNEYRGDSFICAAAIHSGLFPDARGGCGVLRRKGDVKTFPSSIEHEIESIGVNASFPLAITFDLEVGSLACGRGDQRWYLTLFTIGFSSLLPFLLKSPAVFFSTVFTIVFFNVALVSDPPDEPHMLKLSAVQSAAVGNFLPAAFVAYFLYKNFLRHTLPVRLHRLELRDIRTCLKLYSIRTRLKLIRTWLKHNIRTWLWLWATWLGSLSNVVEQQIPGIYIGIALFICAYDQVRVRHKEATLAYYIGVYVMAIFLLLAVVYLSQLRLHLHHYFWSLSLIPGASTKNPSALFYQGFLHGIFINGVARWGFDSILKPREGVPRATISTAPIETHQLITANTSAISFTVKTLPRGYSGINILENNVLRYQGFLDNSNLYHDRYREPDDMNERFYQVGLVKTDDFRGLTMGEYTKPVVWLPNGTVGDPM